MNKHINEILISFLKKENVDYSLMINGLWGCGKTYYVNHEFRDIALGEKYKFIYQSLAGENDLLHFKRDILVKLLYDNKAKADNNLVTNIIEIAGCIPTLNNTVGHITKLKDISEDKLFKIMKWNKTLLVIDDFERIGSKICHKDILGVVYDTFISKNIHTIFVSEEIKIDDKDYQKQKEKVIRRTITYEPDLRSQLEEIISKNYKNKKINEYYKRCSPFFTDILLKLEIKNLRTITFILDHCDDIFEAFKDEMKDDILNAIMTNVSILTNEIKDGTINTSHTKFKNGLDKITAYPLFLNLEKKKEEEKTYAEIFYEKYNLKLRMKFIYIDSIFTFLLNGYFNKNLFIQEYESIFLNKGPEEENVIGIILSHKEIEEAVLKDAVNKLIKYLKEGRYHLRKINNLYTILRFMDERKYIPKFKINYKILFEKAIKESSKNPDNIPDEYVDEPFVSVYDLSKTEEDVYKEIIKNINKIVEANINKSTSDKIKDLFIHIINDDGKQYEIYKSYGGISNLLMDIVKTSNQHLFRKLNNKGIYFFECIIHVDILKVSNTGQYGYDQKKYLKIIKEEIEKYTEKRINNMRKLRYKEFIKKIEYAIAHLEKTKNSNNKQITA